MRLTAFYIITSSAQSQQHFQYHQFKALGVKHKSVFKLSGKNISHKTASTKIKKWHRKVMRLTMELPITFTRNNLDLYVQRMKQKFLADKLTCLNIFFKAFLSSNCLKTLDSLKLKVYESTWRHRWILN